MKLKWLLLASAGYLTIAFGIASQLGDGILKLKPNEFGDLLAGVFAPLAFSWFVAAVWMQREELSLQRQELALQRDELKGTKIALQETSKQSAIQAQALVDQSVLSRDMFLKDVFLRDLKTVCVSLHNVFGIEGLTYRDGQRIAIHGLYDRQLLHKYILSEDFESYLHNLKRIISDLCLESLTFNVQSRTSRVDTEVMIKKLYIFVDRHHSNDITSVIENIYHDINMLMYSSVFYPDHEDPRRQYTPRPLGTRKSSNQTIADKHEEK